MDVHLPAVIAEKIQVCIEANLGDTPVAVIEKALGVLDAGTTGDRKSSDALLHRLQQYKGMAKGWTVEDMLRDRRDGLL